MPHNCASCGEVHSGLPAITAPYPSLVGSIPREEYKNRLKLHEDICIVDDSFYFIRALLLIPIHNLDEKLGFSVWVSLKKENTQTYVDNFESVEIGPFFGWFSNELNFQGEPTLNLKTRVHFQGGGLRPIIELEPTNHPLSLAQREGITVDEAWNIAHQYIE